MTFTLLSVVFAVVVSFAAVVSAYLGYKSGLVKSAVKLAITVSSAFLGAAVTVLIVGMFKDQFTQLAMNIEALESLGDILSDYGETFAAILCMVVSAVMFVPVFGLLYFISKVTVSVIYKRKSKGARANTAEHLPENASFFDKNDKKFGAVIGAFCGLFAAVAILSPIVGTLRSASAAIDVVHELQSSLGEDELDLDVISNYESYTNDFSVVVLDALGAGTLFDITTSVSVDGQMTSLSSEFDAVGRIGLSDTLSAIQNISDFNTESVRSFENFVDVIEEAPIIKSVIVASVKNLANAWLNGGEYLGIYKPGILTEGAVSGFADEIFKVLTTSTTKTICADLRTFLGLCIIFNDYASVLESEDYTYVVDSLISGELINRIRDELAANPHMLQVEHAIDEIIMQVVAEEISDFGKYDFLERDELFEQIATVLTDTSDISSAARADYVFGELNEALNNYGVYTSDDVSKKIASVLISGIPDVDGEVTVESVRSYFDSFLSGNGGIFN